MNCLVEMWSRSRRNVLIGAEVGALTRAPLGYFYNAPHWGGGEAISSPPLISETTGPILKIQAAFESPGKTVMENKFY